MNAIDNFYKDLKALMLKNGYSINSLKDELKIGTATLNNGFKNRAKMQWSNFEKVIKRFPELKKYEQEIYGADLVEEPSEEYESKNNLNRFVIDSFNRQIESFDNALILLNKQLSFLMTQIESQNDQLKAKDEQIANLHGMLHHIHLKST